MSCVASLCVGGGGRCWAMVSVWLVERFGVDETSTVGSGWAKLKANALPQLRRLDPSWQHLDATKSRLRFGCSLGFQSVSPAKFSVPSSAYLAWSSVVKYTKLCSPPKEGGHVWHCLLGRAPSSWGCQSCAQVAGRPLLSSGWSTLWIIQTTHLYRWPPRKVPCCCLTHWS